MRLWAHACIAAVVALCATGEARAQLLRYVNAQTGNDANAGTVDAPWRTLTHAVSRTGNHTILYHAGTFTEPTIRVNGRTGFHLTRDPRYPGRSELHGGVVFTQWGQPQGAAYPAIDTSQEPLGPPTVTEDYQQDSDGSITTVAGAYFGHLRRVWSVVECEALPGSWCFEYSTRRTWIHASDSTDPRTNGHVYRWGRRGSAVRFVNCQESSSSGFVGLHWCDFLGAGRGATLYGLNCRGCTFSDSTACDHGWHAFGFGGSFSRENTFRNLRVVGSNWDDQGTLSGAITKAIPFVFAGTEPGGTNPGNGGNVGEDLEYIACPLMDVYGQPLADRNHLPGGYDVVGATMGISHGGSPDTMNDVVWRRLRAVAWNANTNLTLVGASDHTVPTAPAAWEDFNIRVEDSLLTTARGFVAPGIGVRTTTWLLSGGQSNDLGFGCQVTDGCLWVESCAISGAAGAAAGSALFRIAPSARLSMIGCTVYAPQPQHPLASLVVHLDASGSWLARQCIFQLATPGPLARSLQSVAPQQCDVRDCWYSGVGDPIIVDASGSWSLAQWRSLVDSDGIYDIDPQLANPGAGDCSPTPGGAAHTMTRLVPLHAARGINGFLYNGSYGAWQFGMNPACPPDIDHDGFVTGADFDLYVAMFEAGDAQADFDADGFVTGADFDAFVAAFEAGCA